VVIIVAFTALCSFAIPNEEFAYAFRILKFVFIFLCAWVGYYGFLLGILVVLIHLSRLESFGVAYLSPLAGNVPGAQEDEKDSFVRFPLRKLTKRPFFVRKGERTKLKIK
jgi:spore germination protein